MLRHTRIMRGGMARTLALGLVAGALLAACDPRTPNENEPLPDERNPDPQAPPAAGAPSAAGQPAGQPSATQLPPDSPSIAASEALGGAAAETQGAHVAARAELEPVANSTATGVVEFVPNPDGMLTIQARLTGLEPGTHGLHIHEGGDCSAPDGSSAGDHFAPENDSHGSPAAEHAAHHTGDLGNVTATAAGAAEKTMQDDELALDGQYGIIGRAIVVHVDADDLRTDPSGNSGDPVACGVIEAAAHG